jgi:galactokinase
MNPSELKHHFISTYGNRIDNPVIFFSPGRVNLIGEHTDYNNGFVLPCALNFGTYLIASKNDKGNIRLKSLNFAYSSEVDANSFEKDDLGEWVNYPLGVIDQFRKRELEIPGLDLLFYGDIPNGAGLSSSASIEMATAVALNYFLKTDFSTLEMVKMCQIAENKFVGMNCGIMDQFAVGFGEESSAVFLNCGTLKYDLVPLVLGDFQLIIVNSNKRRGLTDSKYNERRAECEEALKILKPLLQINHLSELGLDQLEIIDNKIKDNTIRRRVHHIITENSRVLNAVNALHNAELGRFGELMNQSHDSLKDDYEVTGFELDTLVYESRQIDGVIGSRMTGGGFGGCTVNLVNRSRVDPYITQLRRVYLETTGLEPTFYTPTIGNGARVINNI